MFNNYLTKCVLYVTQNNFQDNINNYNNMQKMLFKIEDIIFQKMRKKTYLSTSVFTIVTEKYNTEVNKIIQG